jgi:hypothetical protein
MNRLNMDKFAVDITPNWEGLVRSTQRNGAQNRVYFVELLWDQEVQHTICERYGLTQDLDSDDPYFELKRLVKLQRFLGYDYVRCSLDDFKMPLNWDTVNDTASLQRNEGRNFINQHGKSLKHIPGQIRSDARPVPSNGMRNICPMICALSGAEVLPILPNT